MPRKKPAAKKTAIAAKLVAPTPEAVLQVKLWVVEGQQAADILESAAAEFPNQQPAAVLSAALEALGSEAAGIDVDVAKGFLLNAYREVYRRAFEINDFANALAALRSFERQVPQY
jgi:hypothetical protein